MSAPDRPASRPQRTTSDSPARQLSEEAAGEAKPSASSDFDFSIEPPVRPSRRPARQPVTAISGHSADLSAESSESTPSESARTSILSRFSPAADPEPALAASDPQSEPKPEPKSEPKSGESVESDEPVEPEEPNVAKQALASVTSSVKSIFGSSESKEEPVVKTTVPDTAATERGTTVPEATRAPELSRSLPSTHSASSVASTVSSAPSELKGVRSALSQGVTQETVPLPVLNQLPKETVAALPVGEEAAVSRERKDAGIEEVLEGTATEESLGEDPSIEEKLLHQGEESVKKSLSPANSTREKPATQKSTGSSLATPHDTQEAAISRENKDAGIKDVLSETTTDKSLGVDPSIEEKLVSQNEEKIQKSLAEHQDDKETIVSREAKDVGIKDVLSETATEKSLSEDLSVEEKLLSQNEEQIQKSLAQKQDDKEAVISREAKDAGIKDVFSETATEKSLGEDPSIEEKLLSQNEAKIQKSLAERQDDKEAVVSREAKDSDIKDVLSETSTEKSLGEDPSIEEKLLREDLQFQAPPDVPSRPSSRPTRPARPAGRPLGAKGESESESDGIKTRTVSESESPSKSTSEGGSGKPGPPSTVPKGEAASGAEKTLEKPKEKPSKADLIAARIARARAEAAQKPDTANLGGPRPLGPKPVFNKAPRVDASKFDHLSAALSRGPPGRRSSSKSESESEPSVAEPAAPIESLPSQSRARPRGPKRRLPTQAKAAWSSVVTEIWSVAAAADAAKPEAKAVFDLGARSAQSSVDETAPGIARTVSETRANNAFNQALSPKSGPLADPMADPANSIEAAPFRLPGQQLDRAPAPAEDQPGLPQIASLIDREVGVPTGMDHLSVSPDALQDMQQQIAAQDDLMPSLAHLVDRPVTPTYSRPASPVEGQRVSRTFSDALEEVSETPSAPASVSASAFKAPSEASASAVSASEVKAPSEASASAVSASEFKEASEAPDARSSSSTPVPTRPSTRPERPQKIDNTKQTDELPQGSTAPEKANAELAHAAEPAASVLDPELQERVAAAKEKIRLARERKSHEL